MDAVDTELLIEKLKEYIDKPSEYTLAKTCNLVSSAITALQILNSQQNAEING